MLETYYVHITKRGRAYPAPIRLTRWGRWCAAFQRGQGPLFWIGVIVTTAALYGFIYATLWLGLTLEM